MIVYLRQEIFDQAIQQEASLELLRLFSLCRDGQPSRHLLLVLPRWDTTNGLGPRCASPGFMRPSCVS